MCQDYNHLYNILSYEIWIYISGFFFKTVQLAKIWICLKRGHGQVLASPNTEQQKIMFTYAFRLLIWIIWIVCWMTGKQTCITCKTVLTNAMFKWLIMVGRELRQQHPSDLLSCAGTSRERRSRDVPPDNKSRPTVINPDYNMTKQRYITRIYDKIRSKSPPNRATAPTCLHCDVTHLSLTTGVVALHIAPRRVRVREEHRQTRKIVWPVNAGRAICRYQNNLCGIINHHKHIWECFCGV